MKKLKWHTFAGGTSGANKNSYQATTGGLNGREMYLIDPVATSSGRFSGYSLKYFGIGGYRNIGMFRSHAAAKTKALEHYKGNTVQTNPSRKKRKVTAKRKATKKRIVARKKTVRRNPRRKSAVRGFVVQFAPLVGGVWRKIGTFDKQPYATEYAKALHAKAKGRIRVRVMHG